MTLRLLHGVPQKGLTCLLYLLSFLKSVLTPQLSRKPSFPDQPEGASCRSQILELVVGIMEADFGLHSGMNSWSQSSPDETELPKPGSEHLPPGVCKQRQVTTVPWATLKNM